MNHIRKKDHIYDVVVVGGGLSGLVTAVTLINKGLDVCVLDGADVAGGYSRLVYSPIGLVDNGLKFFPDSASSRNSLMKLNEILKHPIEFGSLENGPITFNNGDIKPFVGFGKDAPDFHRELSYFLEPRRLEVSKSLGHLVGDLIGSVGDRFFPSSLVTRYVGSEGRIESVIINGQKNIFGREFVHAASPYYLNTLLSDEMLSAKNKQKIVKSNYWTILGLDIYHENSIQERSELYLLNGTTKDDLGPCVGFIHPVQPGIKEDKTFQHSQWMTFVDHESGEDPEVIAAMLKKIRRQIKRVYPEIFEKSVSERILVAPFSEVELSLKYEKRGVLSGFKNLWLGHGTASKHLNLVGSILQGLLVAEQIMGVPQVEIELEMGDGE